MDKRPGKSAFGKDYVRVMFKNGSYFDNIAARESSRGKRRHGKNFLSTLNFLIKDINKYKNIRGNIFMGRELNTCKKVIYTI